MVLTARLLDAGDATAWRMLRVEAVRDHPLAFLATVEEVLSTPEAELAMRLERGQSYGLFQDGALIGMAALVQPDLARARPRGNSSGGGGAGAKILGPFEVGEGAKIGSNSVVTKAVPAGATVVGIPGRVIVKRQGEEDARRKEMEERMGFDAYGVTEEMPDPVARAMRSLLDHMHAVDDRIENMCKALRKVNSEYQNGELPPLHEEDFDCVRDDDEVGR